MLLRIDTMELMELHLMEGRIRALVLFRADGVPCGQLEASLLATDVPAMKALEEEILKRLKVQLKIESADLDDGPPSITPRSLVGEF